MKVFAQNISNPVIDPDIGNLSGPEYFNRALPFIFNTLILLGFIYFLIKLIVASYNFLTAGHSQNKYEEARDTLIYSFVGIGIIFSFYALVRLVGYMFGIENLQNLQVIFPEL
jgi:hypothetical protein